MKIYNTCFPISDLSHSLSYNKGLDFDDMSSFICCFEDNAKL